LAIGANALNISLRRRGTTRQLSGVIIICLLSALFLLLAIIWFTLHFNGKQAPLSSLEIAGLLGYVILCGWLLPMGATLAYYLFAQPRAATQSSGHAQQNTLNPPRYQPGVESPFVFSNDRPWGWLEYRNGNFQGQRLALKRVVATLGRDENCDIWLDDDMASRYHAELAWDAGRVCLTDNGSLNGLMLNGHRIHGNVQVASNDVIEIGSHQFAVILVDSNVAQVEQDDDPLLKHTWRSTLDLQSKVMPIAHTEPANPSVQPVRVPETQGHEAARPDQAGDLVRMLLICDGELLGMRILLHGPVITLGRGPECDFVINDSSISRQHVQFLRQADGDYVQDLGSLHGSLLNNEPLHGLRLLQIGDIICVGNIHLEYVLPQANPLTPVPPPFARQASGPTPLRLPSRPVGQ
jgi:pSer/pThr/pTyr-binding forkhead associated (FHA) protein